MISHRYKCIYVKVPKCASTTFLDYFSRHCNALHSMKPWWYGTLVSNRVQSVAKVVNLYPDYFTFSFVRDPFERFVSTWLDARRRAQARCADLPGHPIEHGSIRDFAELCGELLSDVRHLWGREAQDFFIRNRARKYGAARIRLEHLGFEMCHARPQVDFLLDCNPRRLFGVPRVNDDPLSFIGSVDRFEADFQLLLKAADLPVFELVNRNSSGSGAGPERRKNHRAWYDDTTRRLVQDIYGSDLEFTGRDFDDGRTIIAVPARKTRAAGTRPGRLKRTKRFLARAWFNVSALEVRLEERITRAPRLVRLLRPLKRLRRPTC